MFGPDVIEENERAHHVPARVRQHAADFESAEVAPALVDDIHAARFTRPARVLSPIFRWGKKETEPETPRSEGRGQRDLRYSARSLFSPLDKPNEKCAS